MGKEALQLFSIAQETLSRHNVPLRLWVVLGSTKEEENSLFVVKSTLVAALVLRKPFNKISVQKGRVVMELKNLVVFLVLVAPWIVMEKEERQKWMKLYFWMVKQLQQREIWLQNHVAQANKRSDWKPGNRAHQGGNWSDSGSSGMSGDSRSMLQFLLSQIFHFIVV